MTDTCPSCGAQVEGRFCSNCGAGLDDQAACAACGSKLPRGGRFCNQCGAPTAAARLALSQAAAAARPGGSVPWIIAGAALVIALVAILLPRLRTQDTPAPAASVAPFAAAGGAAAPAMGDPRAVDIASMTPREAATRLFNRVMESVANRDSAQAKMFLPMAIAAYGRVGDLDLDEHFHLAQLHKIGGDPAAERAEADTILAADPNHLFGLFSAAEAEQDRGNAAAARDLYTRFLQHYDAEVARGLAEYKDHEQLLPSMKTAAETAVK
jgi:hypothetical protein